MLRTLCLAFIAVIGSSVFALAIDSANIVAPADPASVGRYTKLELEVALSGIAATQFYETRSASGGLLLAATFVSPTSQALTVPGYYDGAAWRVRFSPQVTGAWTFSVSATDSSGASTLTGGSFTCVESGLPGFAIIDGPAIRFTEGQPAFAIGHNNGWAYNIEQPALSDMAARGENLLSFWQAVPWARPSWTSANEPFWAERSAIENIEGGLGNYNQAACQYMDGLVSRAESAGVLLLPSVWSHGQLRLTGTHSWGQGWWTDNPYSTLCTATDFFKMTNLGSDTPQWSLQKNVLRYLVARWGYSRAVAGWVGIVEVDGTTGFGGTVGNKNVAQTEAWLIAVRNYVAGLDTCRLNNGKFLWTYSKTDYQSDSATWDKGWDAHSMDSYTQQTNDVNIASTIATHTRAMRGTGEPGFHAEFGGEAPTATQPTHLHNGIWAGTAAGAALMPLLWCDAGSFPMLTDAAVGELMRTHIQILSQFTADLTYISSNTLVPATLTVAAPCRGWAMRLSDRGFGWIQNTSANITPVSLTVSGLANGHYVVTWFDAWTSGATPFQTDLPLRIANGILTTSLPALARRDIAFKFAMLPNGIPVANDQVAVTDEDTAVPISLSASDSDNDPLTYAVITLPAHGSLSGTLPNVTFTPAANYSGTDSFTFRVNDGFTNSNTATVAITINGSNDAPVAGSMWATPNPALINQTVTLNIEAFDPDGDALVFVWNFGDDTQAVTTSTASTTHVYSATQTFNARVTVTDFSSAAASASTPITVNVFVPNPVTVTFQDGVNAYAGTRDTHIKGGTTSTQNKNFNTATNVEICGSPDTAALLKWDLSAIPAGSTVQSVTLNLYITDASTQSFPLYDLKCDWVENGATWKAFATGSNWLVAGAAGALDRGATSLAALKVTPTGSQTTTLNAAGIAAVQNWINAPAANFGFIAQNYTASTDAAKFSPRSHATVTRRPKITVIYLPAQ